MLSIQPCGTQQSRLGVYEIKAKPCMESSRSDVCNQADRNTRYRVMIYNPNGLMRYKGGKPTFDDIPSLSDWIKKSKSFDLDFLCS